MRDRLIRDLRAGLFNEGKWFAAQLFLLIAKADEENLKLLKKGFPKEVKLYVEFRDVGGKMFLELDG